MNSTSFNEGAPDAPSTPYNVSPGLVMGPDGRAFLVEHTLRDGRRMEAGTEGVQQYVPGSGEWDHMWVDQKTGQAHWLSDYADKGYKLQDFTERGVFNRGGHNDGAWVASMAGPDAYGGGSYQNYFDTAEQADDADSLGYLSRISPTVRKQIFDTAGVGVPSNLGDLSKDDIARLERTMYKIDPMTFAGERVSEYSNMGPQRAQTVGQASMGGVNPLYGRAQAGAPGSFTDYTKLKFDPNYGLYNDGSAGFVGRPKSLNKLRFSLGKELVTPGKWFADIYQASPGWWKAGLSLMGGLAAGAAGAGAAGGEAAGTGAAGMGGSLGGGISGGSVGSGAMESLGSLGGGVTGSLGSTGVSSLGSGLGSGITGGGIGGLSSASNAFLSIPGFTSSLNLTGNPIVDSALTSMGRNAITGVITGRGVTPQGLLTSGLSGGLSAALPEGFGALGRFGVSAAAGALGRAVDDEDGFATYSAPASVSAPVLPVLPVWHSQQQSAPRTPVWVGPREVAVKGLK